MRNIVFHCQIIISALDFIAYLDRNSVIERPKTVLPFQYNRALRPPKFFPTQSCNAHENVAGKFTRSGNYDHATK